MYDSVRRIISVGFNEWMDGKYKKKADWIMAQPSQVVAVASQIIWTLNTEDAIRDNSNSAEAIEVHLNIIINQLRELTNIVRGEIPAIVRKIIVALITI
jgi:dynein heavy chain